MVVVINVSPPSSTSISRGVLLHLLLLSSLTIYQRRHRSCIVRVDASVVDVSKETAHRDDEYHDGRRRRRRSMTFLSGVADTHQMVESSSSIIRHRHLVCFRKGGRRRASTSNSLGGEGGDRCCSDLRRNGLLPSSKSRSSSSRRGGRECEDLIATVPLLDGDVVPAFYLALEDDDDGGGGELRKTTTSRGSVGGAGGFHYRQHRKLRIREDREEESLRDIHPVEAYSPFHLTDFAASPPSSSEPMQLPLWGRVSGVISDDGGMHRAYRQRMHIILDVHDPPSGGDGDGGVHRRRLIVNSTILLPISEGVFVDADDPLLMRQPEAGNNVGGAYCGMSIFENYDDGNHNKETTASATTIRNGPSYSSQCNIEFVHPEIIDIEQPSFASRQHVVAYRVSSVALLELSLPPTQRDNVDGGSSLSWIGGEGSQLDIVIDYGTTMHVRYPPPIVVGSASTKKDDGLIDIIVRQPVLYSASASLEYASDGNDRSSTIDGRLAAYSLRTNDFDDTRRTSSTASFHLLPLDPIVIRIAVGMDADYWLVTLATMTSALIGGMLVIWSLDSISEWR